MLAHPPNDVESTHHPLATCWIYKVNLLRKNVTNLYSVGALPKPRILLMQSFLLEHRLLDFIKLEPRKQRAVVW